MDIPTLGSIIHHLNKSLDDAILNIRHVKNNSPKTGHFEVASTAKDLELKVLEMKKLLNPLFNSTLNKTIE